MSEHNRLKVYDQLRLMHGILKAIPARQDAWEQNALEAVHSVLYMAEHIFTCQTGEMGELVVEWNKTKFPKGEQRK